MFETERDKRAIVCRCRLATQLNGAAQSGAYDHISPAAVAEALAAGRVFEFLEAELPASVWNIAKLTDVDRHEIAREWKTMSEAYEPAQFHVTRSGLALLVAYLLHTIDIRHVTAPR